MTKFSITCLTYKRPHLLEEALYSILQQTCQDFELIIINDCPGQELRFEHPQVRLFNQPRFPSLGDKRNFALDQCTGQYVIMLDDDDLFLPKYLENIYQAIDGFAWLSPQKAIRYSSTKIEILPHIIGSTFVYLRTAAPKARFPSTNFDEIVPFYKAVQKEIIAGRRYLALQNPDVGYVYRRETLEHTYSMSEMGNRPAAEQQVMLDGLAITEPIITLEPHWKNDYTNLILQATAHQQVRITPPPRVAVPNYWSKVKGTWQQAGQFLDAMASRGYMAATLDAMGVSDQLGKQVDEATYRQRQRSCFGDEFTPACSMLRRGREGGLFCGACGCGEKALARLDAETPGQYTKLHYPQLTCPLRKPGFSNYESAQTEHRYPGSERPGGN